MPIVKYTSARRVGEPLSLNTYRASASPQSPTWGFGTAKIGTSVYVKSPHMDPTARRRAHGSRKRPPQDYDALTVGVVHGRLAQPIAQHLRRFLPDVVVRSYDSASISGFELEEIDVLVGFRIAPSLLPYCRRVRYIQLTSSGFDHLRGLKLPAASTVANAAGLNSEPVAEFVMMGILAAAKKLRSLLESQRVHQWAPLQLDVVHGKRLVIVGLGHVGRAVARLANAFGLEVIGVTKTSSPPDIASQVFHTDRLAEAFRGADYVVVAVPADSSTNRIINAETLAALPDHAVLINVARDSVINQDDLYAALREGRLGGALLDVHAEEPMMPNNQRWDVPNVIVTPHIAYSTPNEAESIARLTAKNIERLRQGVPLINALSTWQLEAVGATLSGDLPVSAESAFG